MNAPKGVLTDDLRAQIAERKQPLLEFLRSREPSATSFSPPILPRASSEPAPLSFAQERLWFLEQLEPGRAIYNICRAWRVIGNLDIPALQASLNEIVQRHEVLRSAIRFVDGRAVQIVQEPFELKLRAFDLEAISEAARQQEIRHAIRQEAERPFDFASGKFLRAELGRVADDEHVLIISTHHVVSDAWSMGILSRELWSLYRSYAEGRSLEVERLPIQYADFAVWQREWLRGEALDAQLAYWKKQLSDLPILNLPTDRVRPPQQSFRGARVPIVLSDSLTAAINNLSNEYGVTPFMTLLAAFQVLLYRYSGQDDIAVGSPIANRRRSELEPLIGFFVNTLVLRSDLSGNPTFKELLARVRDVCLAAYEHQDLPFEKLVQELQPERDQSRNPLFQVMFALQNATQRLSSVDGVCIEPLAVETGRSLFDLSLFLRERNGKYVGFFEYSRDLFGEATIERMVGHLRTLLEAIGGSRDQPISSLPLLSDAERHQLLVEWNDTAADYPKDKCIHVLFEEQVERTPDRIAISFNDQQLTYRELNMRANQLAHYLRKLGVGPDTLVGICVERSLEMVVGLLGILKAGAAYMPVDPTYPKERLAYMLGDARTPVLLTQAQLLRTELLSDLTSEIFGGKIKPFCLDHDWEAVTEYGDENPDQQSKSANLAYVIYTSGSTGNPKGVQVSHDSVVNCLYSVGRYVGLADSDVFLAVTTISFDIAALELYLPLMIGAKIILAGRDAALGGRRLLEILTQFGVTTMQATPCMWQSLLESGWQGNHTFKLLCGGEALSRRLANELVRRGSVWNLYGPTETTIWSTIYKVQPGEGPVPIGRPIGNTQLYILDASLQPVPIGVHGEAYIRGAGVSKGYLNGPELASARFVPDRSSKELDFTLYRTGDLARYLPDGNIEYLGRSDTQVKIRGYRVELAEIEAALTQHPAVKDCVVAFRDREFGDEKLLAAYFVPEDQPPPFAELRSFLAQKLTAYMLPSFFVPLKAIPRTPNGKIDRNALPLAEVRRPPLSYTFTEARTNVEEAVAQVWREVLKVDDIGVDDNFFELGGHSLSLIRIAFRLGELFDKEIPLHLFLSAPTVAGLAKIIEQQTAVRAAHPLPPIIAVQRNGPMPLSFNQEQLWHIDQMIPNNRLFNMPYVFRISGTLRVDMLEKAIQEIVNRHEALRTIFCTVNGRPAQIIQQSTNLSLAVIDLRFWTSEDASREAARLMLEQREQPFTLATGPLFRTKLLRLTETDAFLLLTMHHIIADEWSMLIVQRELAVLYGAFLQGDTSPLTDVPIQFADYAAWERQSIKCGLFDAQLEHWRRQLATSRRQFGSTNECKEVNGQLYFRAACEEVEIEEPVFVDVRRLSQKEVCTPVTVLLAALNMMMHFYTGEKDIRIGIVTANRESRDKISVIGNFTNTIILRTKIEPILTVRHLLAQLRDNAFTSYSNQLVPFEYIAQILAKEDSENQATRFTVQLIYNNVNGQDVEFPGLSFAPFSIRRPGVGPEVMISDVDLNFRLRELSTKVTGSLTYKTAKVNQRCAASIIETFKTILSSITRSVDCSLSSILAGEVGDSALSRGWRPGQRESR